jgi:hypothetical protein
VKKKNPTRYDLYYIVVLMGKVSKRRKKSKSVNVTDVITTSVQQGRVIHLLQLHKIKPDKKQKKQKKRKKSEVEKVDDVPIEAEKCDDVPMDPIDRADDEVDEQLQHAFFQKPYQLPIRNWLRGNSLTDFFAPMTGKHCLIILDISCYYHLYYASKVIFEKNVFLLSVHKLTTIVVIERGGVV